MFHNLKYMAHMQNPDCKTFYVSRNSSSMWFVHSPNRSGQKISQMDLNPGHCLVTPSFYHHHIQNGSESRCLFVVSMCYCGHTAQGKVFRHTYLSIRVTQQVGTDGHKNILVFNLRCKGNNKSSIGM